MRRGLRASRGGVVGIGGRLVVVVVLGFFFIVGRGGKVTGGNLSALPRDGRFLPGLGRGASFLARQFGLGPFGRRSTRPALVIAVLVTVLFVFLGRSLFLFFDFVTWLLIVYIS